AAATTVTGPAAAALVGLDGGGPEGGVDEDDLELAVGGLDVGVVGRSVGAAGLGLEDGGARDRGQRRGLDLGGDVAGERLALRALTRGRGAGGGAGGVAAGAGDRAAAEPESTDGRDGQCGLADGGEHVQHADVRCVMSTSAEPGSF